MYKFHTNATYPFLDKVVNLSLCMKDCGLRLQSHISGCKRNYLRFRGEMINEDKHRPAGVNPNNKIKTALSLSALMRLFCVCMSPFLISISSNATEALHTFHSDLFHADSGHWYYQKELSGINKICFIRRTLLNEQHQ